MFLHVYKLAEREETCYLNGVVDDTLNSNENTAGHGGLKRESNTAAADKLT